MATINILVAVEAAKLAQRLQGANPLSPGTESSPTNLGAWGTSDVFISMIAGSEFIDNKSQDGRSELTVDANPGDIVTWSMTTYDGNADYSVYIYNGHFNPNHLAGPLYANSQRNVHYPAGTNPKVRPTGYVNHFYNTTGIVTQSGRIQYTLSFALVDNSDGRVLGYFYWDPFIDVKGIR